MRGDDQIQVFFSVRSERLLMENRSGIAVNTRVTLSTGTAEREAALAMVDEIGGSRQITVGADKGYDTRDFVKSLRQLRATPHIAQNVSGRKTSSIDEGVTRHPGYMDSQSVRKRIEEIFGWFKTVGGMRKIRHGGRDLVRWMFTLSLVAYNLTRKRNLLAAAPS